MMDKELTAEQLEKLTEKEVTEEEMKNLSKQQLKQLLAHYEKELRRLDTAKEELKKLWWWSKTRVIVLETCVRMLETVQGK